MDFIRLTEEMIPKMGWKPNKKHQKAFGCKKPLDCCKQLTIFVIEESCTI